MALKSISVVQCVADPTNTQNVIVADYAKVDVNDILKSTLPYTMVMALGILYIQQRSCSKCKRVPYASMKKLGAASPFYFNRRELLYRTGD